MTNRIAFSFPFLLLALGAWTATSAQAPGGTEKIVRSLDDQERVAVLNRDRSALQRLWSDQFTVNAPSNQVVIGKEAVLDLVARGVIHYSSFARSVEFMRIDHELGIVMGAETVRPTGDAPLAGQTVQRRFTNIWKKEGGAWRMIARHASVIPVR